MSQVKGAGECFKCKSGDLSYCVMELGEGWLYYPYECGKCGHEGKEFYNIEYTDSE